jgi:serine/threonine protein kinase
LRHPHIVQFLGWSHPEDSEYLLLVEEFGKGGNLSKFLSRNDILISWDTRISICLDVARAMLYLHKSKVIYRDLKSENILVDDTINPRVAKLCDFGLARSISDADKRSGPPMSICGTDEWMAPEVILGTDYDERSDVFSYGMLMLECILGPSKVKYDLERIPAKLFELDTDKVRNLAEKTSCPRELLELALFCCAYEPNARPDFHEILLLLMNIATGSETITYQEIKIDDLLAQELTESLSRTEPSSPRTPELRTHTIKSSSAPGSQSLSSATNLKKMLEAPSIFSLDAKAEFEYVRVESMVESNTLWNVRISPNASVKDVCDKVGKKLDEKYQVVQLYVVHGKKKVLLGADQTIADVRASFEKEKAYKFGVNYLESTSAPLSRGKNGSGNITAQRRGSLFGSARGKKDLK